MKIVLLTIGKTNEQYLLDGVSKYEKRLKHSATFEIIEISNIKKTKSISNIELIKMAVKQTTKQT